jgi:hypothetical protein
VTANELAERTARAHFAVLLADDEAALLYDDDGLSAAHHARMAVGQRYPHMNDDKALDIAMTTSFAVLDDLRARQCRAVA